MVKGSSRQVIVVKSPQETLFEQAIFFVKEEALQQTGYSHQSVVAQAQKIARDYSQNDGIFTSSLGIHGGLWMILGASIASFLWAVGLGLYVTL